MATLGPFGSFSKGTIDRFSLSPVQTMPIQRLLFLYVIFLHGEGFAQDNLTGYLQPQISLNYDVVADYSHNFSIEQRNYLYESDELLLRTRQFDLNHFSTLKVRDDQSVALGVKYRFREAFEPDRSNELRLTEQFNMTDKFGAVRIGNRFRAEQRITSDRTVHRFRYRLAIDFPLSGESLDVGEPYFVASTEGLLSVAKAIKPEWDQRLTANLGWLLNTETKLQTGLEYRIEDYAQRPENVIFLLMTLVFSL